MSRTRKRTFKVRGIKFKGGVQHKFFFKHRVAAAWNTLPGIVEADTIVRFQRPLSPASLSHLVNS